MLPPSRFFLRVPFAAPLTGSFEGIPPSLRIKAAPLTGSFKGKIKDKGHNPQKNPWGGQHTTFLKSKICFVYPLLLKNTSTHPKRRRLPPSRVLLRVVSLMRRRDTCIPCCAYKNQLLSLRSNPHGSCFFFRTPSFKGYEQRKKFAPLTGRVFWRDTLSFLFQGKGHYPQKNPWGGQRREPLKKPSSKETKRGAAYFLRRRDTSVPFAKKGYQTKDTGLLKSLIRDTKRRLREKCARFFS